MKNESAFLFSLAISPDTEILTSVRELKLRLGKELGRNYGSINSLAHITLFTFWASMNDYQKILKKIEAILAGLDPFELKFSGFAFFPPKPLYTFYIEPDRISGEQIIKYCKKIHTNCDARFKRKYSLVNRVRKDPHMSVGRDLFESDVLACNAIANEGSKNLLLAILLLFGDLMKAKVNTILLILFHYLVKNILKVNNYLYFKCLTQRTFVI